MKIKAERSFYLHEVRKSEIEIIFSGCPESCFKNGLELGAGDGFQAGLLIKYVAHLVCTE